MSEAKKSLPPIDFATFVLSLASNALAHLGELPDPEAEASGDEAGAGEPGAARGPVNLPLAKQTIEILAMIEAKTKGNLDEAEKNLLGSVLYDLRMKFVDAAKAPKK